MIYAGCCYDINQKEMNIEEIIEACELNVLVDETLRSDEIHAVV